MMLIRWLGLVLLVLQAGAAIQAARSTFPQPSARPNILFILTDDQRQDTIAALGNPSIRTPHLDQLVREGTSFTRVISSNPLCVPIRAEILTGVSGFRNGILPGFSNQLDRSLPTFADTLRAAGYHTWYVGKWHTQGRPSEHGFEETLGLFGSGGGKPTITEDVHGRPVTGYRGWVFQSDAGETYPEKGVGLTPDISNRFADAAIEFISRKPERPFFLQLNYTAPHDPLLMPPGYEGMYPAEGMPLPPNFRLMHPFDHGNFWGRDEQLLPWPRTPKDVRADLAAYYAVISHMDESIGRVLRVLEESGQLDNTLIIFASDHGLALGSHGLRGKQNMYEHTINVPLIVRGPGIPQGRISQAQGYLRDIYPTVCDLVGLKIPASVEGKSLKPAIQGQTDIYPYVFGYFGISQRMIRGEGFKFILYPQVNRRQLFDLKKDPLELNNLADKPAYRSRVEDLEQKLQEWRQAVDDPLLAD